MTATASGLELASNEFALHFDSKDGVTATNLGRFLQRAATVARGQGAELQVIGLREGSLDVLLKAVAKSKIAKNAKKEFEKAPVGTTAAGAALVGAVVSALIFATSSGKPTPLAKSAADIIEQTTVTQIQVVTVRAAVGHLRGLSSLASPRVANVMSPPTARHPFPNRRPAPCFCRKVSQQFRD